MKQTFLLVHNGHYNTTIWYRAIRSIEELNEQEGHYARWYWNTTWRDPHFEAALNNPNGNELAVIRHPMNLLPKRATAMVMAFLRSNVIYLNKNGGWCVPTETDTILEERQAETWPDLEQNSFAVYISKWPLGNHYYLTAWPKPIMFSAEKFNTYEEAMAEALKHAPKEKIHWKENPHDKFIYRTEGD